MRKFMQHYSHGRSICMIEFEDLRVEVRQV